MLSPSHYSIFNNNNNNYYYYYYIYLQLGCYPVAVVNPLKVELNPICHLLALLGARHIFHVSGLRVKDSTPLHRYAATDVSKQLSNFHGPVAHEQLGCLTLKMERNLPIASAVNIPYKPAELGPSSPVAMHKRCSQLHRLQAGG